METKVDVHKGGDLGVKAQPGKYLTFKLASEEYGLEILKVQEIIGMMNVTRVPKMPDFVRGIINLRGKLIPVMDMRAKFLLDHLDDTEKTCIIVVEIQGHERKITIGIIVDNVSEVMNISSDQLGPAPSIGTQLDTDFILGMGKMNEKVVILLDIDKVLAGHETTQILSAVN